MKDYLDFITAFAAISALFISIIAITRASKDSRKQLLVGKIEEIYELVVLLSVEYGHLYDTYVLLEKSKNSKIRFEDRNLLTASFQHSLKNSNAQVDMEKLYQMIIRLNVLSNAYLIGEIKYQVIGYSQLFEALRSVLKTRDLKAKEDEFSEPLPTTEKVFELIDQMTAQLVKVINLGSDNKEYLNYRETTFKQKLGLK